MLTWLLSPSTTTWPFLGRSDFWIYQDYATGRMIMMSSGADWFPWNMLKLIWKRGSCRERVVRGISCHVAISQAVCSFRIVLICPAKYWSINFLAKIPSQSSFGGHTEEIILKLDIIAINITSLIFCFTCLALFKILFRPAIKLLDQLWSEALHVVVNVE